MQFIIALKREMWDTVPDWQTQVADVPGIAIEGSNERRMLIEATEQAINEVRSRVGQWCHIEEPIEHFSC